jgi:hypothetical protein
MKRLSALVLLLSLFSLPVAAQAPASCQLCAGVVIGEASLSSAVPSLLTLDASALDSASGRISSVSAEQKSRMTVAITSALPATADIAAVEAEVARIIEWGKANGPFAAIGLSAPALSAELQGYALKRFAVAAQGRELAAAVILPAEDVEKLKALYETGAQSYFDMVLTGSSDVRAWILENDPAKKIATVVAPTHPNVLHDAAIALAAGASLAFIDHPSAAPAVEAFNREMRGDFAADSNHDVKILSPRGEQREEKAIVFVRGEDLRLVVVPPATTPGASILSVAEGEVVAPRVVTSTRAAAITDTGARNRRLLVGLGAASEPFLVTFDRAQQPENVTRESIEVATERGMSVEEIIRNHQAYHAYLESVAPQYIARNETKLRFAIGAGEQIEATIAGEHFFDPQGRSDWVWSDFFINGVRWKYGKIPELPLVQPEKVTQLPLDIHLTNDYRYSLAGESRINGFDTWEVRFEPPPNASTALPLYRGTVWIDKKTFARVQLSMIQLNLSGEVLSNEERLHFVAFDRGSGEVLTPDVARRSDPRALIWLPYRVDAQQVLSTAGRTTSVIRTTDFTNFRVNPLEYDALLSSASASTARMVRDTDQGLRYLEKNDAGERVVKEGFDSSRLFALGGIHHDAGLEYPVVPLGGINYFNFNLADRGIQANVFFAGVVLAVNATDPSFRGTRTNLGMDFFGLGIATENKVYVEEEEIEGETIKTLPMLLATRIGHPFATFGKVDLTLAASYSGFQRAEDTAHDFITPTDTITLNPGLDVSYERHGYSISTAVEQGFRTDWEEWGNGDDYDPAHDSYTRWNLRLGKSFYFPNFQRLGMEVSYFDGRNLDRFSKYELGFFGSQRVRGIQSGSVRAEEMILGHLSYGFVVSDQFRLEAFYDHALLDDVAAGYSREAFQGVGIGGQLIGPWGTIVRMDVGKSIGRNAQDDFVADIVFLKLFN